MSTRLPGPLHRFVMTETTTGLDLLLFLRAYLKMDDERVRGQIMQRAERQVRTCLALDDRLWVQMESASKELEGIAVTHQWERLAAALRTLTNATTTPGIMGRSRREMALRSFIEALERLRMELLHATVGQTDTRLGNDRERNSSSTVQASMLCDQLRKISFQVQKNELEIADSIYIELEQARQMKTLLTTRNSRLKSILEVIEHPRTPLTPLWPINDGETPPTLLTLKVYEDKVYEYTDGGDSSAVRASNFKKIKASISLPQWEAQCFRAWSKDQGYAVSEHDSPENALSRAVAKEWKMFFGLAMRGDAESEYPLTVKLNDYDATLNLFLMKMAKTKGVIWQIEESERNNRDGSSYAKSPRSFVNPSKQNNVPSSIAVSKDSLSLIFTLPTSWQGDLEDIELQLSLAYQKYPGTRDLTLTFGTKESAQGAREIIVGIPQIPDAGLLKKLRAYMAKTLQGLIEPEGT